MSCGARRTAQPPQSSRTSSASPQGTHSLERTSHSGVIPMAVLAEGSFKPSEAVLTQEV